MAPSKAPIDLDALIERQSITINGQTYELRQPEELAPIDALRLQRWSKRLETVANQAVEAETPSDADDREVEELPRKICAIVLVATPDQITTLGDQAVWAVCRAFLRIQSGAPLMATPAPETAVPSTGSTGQP